MVKKPSKTPLPPRIEEIAEIALERMTALLMSNTEYEAIRFNEEPIAELNWKGSQFQACSIALSKTDNLVLQRARVIGTVFEVGTINLLDAHDSRWRESQISNGKIISGNFSGSLLSSVHIRDLRVGYINFIQADISDVLFEHCRFDTIDFVGSKINRVSFNDCYVNEIDLREVKSENLNLSGLDFQSLNGLDGLRNCYLSSSQLIQLSSVFARELGIKVLDT